MFEGVLAFSNLGLPGSAITGGHGRNHETRLNRLMSELFEAATVRGRTLVGILLNEVGNMSELVSKEGRRNFDGMLRNSF